jgi:hypothetical protein
MSPAKKAHALAEVNKLNIQRTNTLARLVAICALI